MKKVVITGAGGFLGRALVKYLLNKGVEVYGIDINSNNLIDIQDSHFHFIKAKSENFNDSLDWRIFSDIDVFYHFAWMGGFGEAFKDYSLQLSNVKQCCDALLFAKKINVKKFVFAGTINEFEIKQFLVDESFNPRYTNLYSAAKLHANISCKTMALMNDIEYNSGCVAMVYGPGNKHSNLPNVVIRNLIHGDEPVLIEGNNLYDLIFIEDVARAFYYIGAYGKNEKDYYVGHLSSELKTFKQWMSEIRDIINPKIKLNFGAYQEKLNLNYGLIAVNSLHDDTGFECKADFKESILETVGWLKSLEDK